jgi:MYXO-CTERM domain-containing protein
MKKRLITLLLASSTLLFSVQKLSADSVVDFTDPGTFFNNGNQYVLGFDFVVANTISINGLGYFDSYMNGLTENHDVGLWDSSGTLLASATVTNADGLEGWFRYATIGNMTLGAGTYTVAGVAGSEDYAFNPVGFSTAPGVTFIQSSWDLTNTLLDPSQHDNLEGYFGANVRVAGAQDRSVPDASATWLMMVGGLGLVAAIRRRR